MSVAVGNGNFLGTKNVATFDSVISDTIVANTTTTTNQSITSLTDMSNIFPDKGTTGQFLTSGGSAGDLTWTTGGGGGGVTSIQGAAGVLSPSTVQTGVATLTLASPCTTPAALNTTGLMTANAGLTVAPAGTLTTTSMKFIGGAPTTVGYVLTASNVDGTVGWAAGGGGGITDVTGTTGQITVTGTTTKNIALTGIGATTVKFGTNAGATGQQSGAIAIGQTAGNSGQLSNAVAIGVQAGQTGQGAQGIAIGYHAAGSSTAAQGTSSIAIGSEAGWFGQGNDGIFIGTGRNVSGAAQGNEGIGIGKGAGFNGQQRWGIAIGSSAGEISQQQAAIAIGVSAGNTSQLGAAIAIGQEAGYPGQSAGAIAIGQSAGGTLSGTGQLGDAIAIGHSAGLHNQGLSAIAMGLNAATVSQAQDCIAIGNGAGQNTQGNGLTESIAIGRDAGSQTQGGASIAIGPAAGQSSQGINCVAIGNGAGNTGQLAGGVAIGNQAAIGGQGLSAIAIGDLTCSVTGQHANSIVINATGASIDTSATNSCKIAPLRNAQTEGLANLSMMLYDATTNEVTISGAATSANSKTFVIDHPVEPSEKYLVHACLEGPEAGVYYRGTCVIDETEECVIELPSYVDALAREFTVHLTQVASCRRQKCGELMSSRVKDGKFKVFGVAGTEFDWLVFGKRLDIDVEPSKSACIIQGDGPYKYLV